MLVTGLSESPVVDISLGKRHSLASCRGQKVFAWGKVFDGFPMHDLDLEGVEFLTRPRCVYRERSIQDSQDILRV